MIPQTYQVSLAQLTYSTTAHWSKKGVTVDQKGHTTGLKEEWKIVKGKNISLPELHSPSAQMRTERRL